MIKVGDNFYRNLEEQVQYLTNYHDVNQGLVQWGIRVVGQLVSADDLPAVYNGEFGDAYAVGTEAPFFFYIWTRASATGEPDYWFPFGEISIAGPQGPEGPKGEPGATGESNMWYYGAEPSNPKEGDMLLQSNGNVLRYQKTGSIELSWVQVTNIKGATGLQGVQGPRGLQGPQGDPGPKGETGDVGGFINIYGVLMNVNELPNPDTLHNRTIAYLIGTGYPYDLYIQAGDADGPVVWVNTGPLNVSTLVYVNGEAQNTWDADTKVDAVTTSGSRRVYGINGTGGQTTYPLYHAISASPILQIVCRDANGQVTVPPEPNLNSDAASKGYVDSQIKYTHYIKIVTESEYQNDVYVVITNTSPDPITDEVELKDAMINAFMYPACGYYELATVQGIRYLSDEDIMEVLSDDWYTVESEYYVEITDEVV